MIKKVLYHFHPVDDFRKVMWLLRESKLCIEIIILFFRFGKV